MEKRSLPGVSSRSIVKPNAKQNNQRSKLATAVSPTGKRPRTSVSQLASARDVTRNGLNKDQIRVVNEDLFDQFMENSLHQALHEAFEPIAKTMFHSEKAILWIDNPECRALYSPTYQIKSGYDDSLPGFIFKTKTVIQVRDPSQTPNGFKSDPSIIPAGSPQLLFALTASGIARAVVHIVQRPRAPGFSAADMDVVQMIVKKFETYGNSIFTSHGISSIALGLYEYNPKPVNSLRMVAHHFRCRKCEMWQIDVTRGVALVRNDADTVLRSVSLENGGVVGSAACNRRGVNAPDVSLEDGYSSEVDGEDGPILAVMQELGKREIWALVLRGRQTQFNAADEAQLQALLPFVLGSYVGFNTTNEKAIFMTQLTELIDASLQLTSSLAPKDGIDAIKKQNLRLLECQRCIVYVISKNRKQLTGHYTSMDKKFAISHGIAGHVARTGEVLTAMNPRDLPMYEANYDTDPGYAPTSIIAGPIRNQNQEIVAVVICLSKLDGETFTDNDKQVLAALNVFSGISIQNIKCYRRANQLTQKMRSFIHMLSYASKESQLRPMLEEILNKAKKVINASRVSFYVPDPVTNKMELFLNIGKENKFGSAFANEVKETKEMRIITHEEMVAMAEKLAIDISEDEDQDRVSLDRLSGSARFSRISGIFSSAMLTSQTIEEHEISGKKNDHICSIPLINNEGAALGILETYFVGDMDAEDSDLLRSFAAIAAISLEKLNIKELAVLGYGDVEISDWMTEHERMSYDIPKKLRLSEKVSTAMFNIDNYNGIGSFKVIFKLFDTFGLMSNFRISAEVLFKFLIKIRQSYQKSAYYNWRHAVDTAQFVASQIIVGKLDKSCLSRFEILALLVAAICHDVDHEEFPDTYETSAGVPFDLLLHKQSVLEAHHCSVTVDVMNDPEQNLFRELNDRDTKTVWNMVINLILATDMRLHYAVIRELENLVDSDEYSSNNAAHRFVLMKCLLKIADLSVTVRPLTDVSKWSVEVAGEFFRQSDLSITPDLVFTSTDQDFEHLDQEASLMGFFKNACIPMLQVVSTACPSLRPNTEMIKDNIQKWARQTNRVVPNFQSASTPK